MDSVVFEINMIAFDRHVGAGVSRYKKYEEFQTKHISQKHVIWPNKYHIGRCGLCFVLAPAQSLSLFHSLLLKILFWQVIP